jgi:hypothetical protein
MCLPDGAAVHKGEKKIMALLAGVNEDLIMEFGGYKWRMLERCGGEALLISEAVLESREYQSSNGDRPISTTWAECELRAYLNGEFLQRFSEDERVRISETHNVNKDNLWFYEWYPGEENSWAPEGGENTTDYVFLLSLEEAVRYFGDSGIYDTGDRPEACVIDDRYNAGRIAQAIDETPWGDFHSPVAWWLRSPGYFGSDAAYVGESGIISVEGGDIWEERGVRPVMWVWLECADEELPF